MVITASNIVKMKGFVIVKGKYISLFVVATILVLIATYYKEPVKSENIIQEDEAVSRVIDSEFRDFNIAYLNMEGENRKLKEEITNLHERNFDLEKLILNSDKLMETFAYPESTKIIYKEIKEKEYLLLYRDERGKHLAINSPGEWRYINFNYLVEHEGLNWTGHNGFYAGFIKDNDINKIIVKENEKVYDAEIIKLNDGTQLWYSIYEHDVKYSGEPDKMKIEALDIDGEVIWEESFNDNVGG